MDCQAIECRGRSRRGPRCAWRAPGCRRAGSRRGRGTAVEERECGKAVRFQCPYHAWIYELDGRLIRAKHTEDLEDFTFEGTAWRPSGRDLAGSSCSVLRADESVTAGLGLHGRLVCAPRGLRTDFEALQRAARLTYDVGANWKIVAENYSECYHCPPVHPLLNKRTPYDLGEDFLAEGPWKGGWMPFAEGCETMSMSGKRDGRPLLYARDETEALRRIYYYIPVRPNLIVALHPDQPLDAPGLAGRAQPEHRQLRPLRRGRPAGEIDISGAVEFWDITNREDYHVVEAQQQGTRSRSWVAGRYNSKDEASVDASTSTVADRYANDELRTTRGWADRIGQRPAARHRDPRSSSACRGRRSERLRRLPAADAGGQREHTSRHAAHVRGQGGRLRFSEPSTPSVARRTTSRRSAHPATRRGSASFLRTQTLHGGRPRPTAHCPRQSSRRRERLPARTASASAGSPLESRSHVLSPLAQASSRSARRPRLTSRQRHTSRPIRPTEPR